MKKATFKFFVLLFAAGVVASCNNSAKESTGGDTTVKQAPDTSKMNSMKMNDTSSKMMDTSHKKGDQVPPPK